MSLSVGRPVTPPRRSASMSRRSPSPHSVPVASSTLLVESEASAPVGSPGWRKRVLSHRLTFLKDNASAEHLTAVQSDAGPKDLIELEQLRASIQSLHQQAREARARRRHSVPPGDELIATFSQPAPAAPSTSSTRTPPTSLSRGGSVRRKAVPVCDLRLLDAVSESDSCSAPALPVTASVPDFERGFPFSKPTRVMDVDAPYIYLTGPSGSSSVEKLPPSNATESATEASAPQSAPRKTRSRKRVSRVRAPTPPRRVSSQIQARPVEEDNTTDADAASLLSLRSTSAGSIVPPRRSSKVEHVASSPSRQMPRRGSVHSLRAKASVQSLRSRSRAPPVPTMPVVATDEPTSSSPNVQATETAAAPLSPPPRPARRRLRTSSSRAGLNKMATSPARPRTADSAQTDDDDTASFCSATWEPEMEVFDEPSSPSCSSSSSSFISSGEETRSTSASSVEQSHMSKATPGGITQDCLSGIITSA